MRAFSNFVHLRRSQRWADSQVEESQLNLLDTVVASARRDVPLYRELYGVSQRLSDRITSIAEFQSLPIVHKNLLKQAFPDRIVADGIDPKDLYPVATSGTSDRVMLFHDEYKRDWDRAADLMLAVDGDRFRPGQRRAIIPADACYERCGADEQGRTKTALDILGQFLFRAHGKRRRVARQMLSTLVRDHFWRLKFLKSFGVDGTAVGDKTLDSYCDELAQWRPQLLSALPMYLYILAKRVKRSGRSPRIPILRPAGGKLTSEMIRVVENAFVGRVRENYGTAELGTIAFDCEHNRQQHLLNELFYVEFIRGGQPVSPGELGELVITDLRNHVAPLIRYAVGDVGRYFEQPCECGRSGLLFTVDGCLEETIVTPSGRAIAGDQVIDFFLRQPGIAYAKVIQREADVFLIEIVAEPGGPEPYSSEYLSESFSEFLGYSVRTMIRPVKRLAPEPSGKYRLVQSSSYSTFGVRWEMQVA